MILVDLSQLRTQLPIVVRLKDLASEFDRASTYYAGYEGQHNDLLRDEATRAAAQLRAAAELVVQGEFTQRQGYDWLHAGWRIITAIGRANLS